MARRTKRQPEDPQLPPPLDDHAPVEDSPDTNAWLANAGDAVGVGLLFIALLTLLSLLAVNRGSLTDVWAGVVRSAFGWGSLPLTLAAIAMSIWLLTRRWHHRELDWPRLVGAEVGVFALLALFHLTQGQDPLGQALDGAGGGLIGYALGWGLAEFIGRWFSLLVWLAVFLVALFVILGRTPWAMYQLLGGRLAPLAAPAPGPPLPAAEPAPPPADTSASPSSSSSKSRKKKAATDTLAPTGTEGETLQMTLLPPIDILERGSEVRYKADEIRERSHIIEDTLAAFGVPARVVTVNQGPAVTQFGIEPGYSERRGPEGVERRKVKVSRIVSLQNDLALALATPSLRILAPVPGQSVVGIEVPNANTSRVALRNIMESPGYKKTQSPLRIALGEDVRGSPISTDLARMPHLLIAGATGSGKSVCINAVIACLLFNNTPDTLKLLMVDPKRVELTGFNGIPHLMGSVIVEMDEVIGALRWAIREMEQRYQLFAAVGVRNIEGYNAKVMASVGAPLPYIVIIIDELADLMMVAPEEAERLICRLAQLARATGIHLVLATQRPSTDVVTGLIKANFPARIAFAVASAVDSRVILDSIGAEKLLGRGDMLYQAPDAPAPVRLQGVYVTDRELDKVVKYWRRVAGPTSPHIEPTPWADYQGEDDSADEKLIAEATTLVRRHRTASVSFLQRHMRIGYPRAARLLDELEARGVVSAASGAKSRTVLLEETNGDGDEYHADIIGPERQGADDGE